MTVYDPINRIAAPSIGTLARFVFAATLAPYFWASAMTKVGAPLGPFTPSAGAYFQIFPKLIEQAGYDPTALGIIPMLVVVAGTLAEFVLPALIIFGAATRPAAIGMIGFIIVQSLTDIIGHGVDAATLGTLFDRMPDGIILDQRLIWIFVLFSLALTGAGPISVDRWFSRAKAPIWLQRSTPDRTARL